MRRIIAGLKIAEVNFCMSENFRRENSRIENSMIESSRLEY